MWLQSFIIKLEKEGFALSDHVICEEIVNENKLTIMRVRDQSEEEFYSESAQLAADNWSDYFFGEITFTIGDPYMLKDNERRRISLTKNSTPEIVNNVLLIPVDALIEGAEVSISIDDTQQSMEISIDEEMHYVNVPTVIINDTIMLPSDIISKLGFEIRWNPKAQQAILTRNFQTKRLILKSTSEVDLMNLRAITVIKGPDNLAVLQFDSLKKTQMAYERLSELEAIIWVEPDSYATLIK